MREAAEHGQRLYRCKECDEVLTWWGVIKHCWLRHTPEGRAVRRVISHV